MSVSLDKLSGILGHETSRFYSEAFNNNELNPQGSFTFEIEGGVLLEVFIQRMSSTTTTPKNPIKSAKDTAKATITLQDEGSSEALKATIEKVKDFFFKEMIPACPETPESRFYDEVVINDEPLIS